MEQKKTILFLCTGNSCRSQMAEGFMRALHGDRYTVYSAGIEKHGLNPNAVKVMAEAGIDISRHYSKTLKELQTGPLDYTVTVCSRAAETCPYFPARVKLLHRDFDDPPALAKLASGPDEALAIYRRVRDDIRDFVEKLPGMLE